MPDLSIRNLAAIRQQSPHTGEALADIQAAVNNMAQQLNAAPVGAVPPPAPHTGISVSGGGGVLDIAIADSTPQFRGKSNFVEVADNASFANPHVVELGAGRNIRLPVGPGTFHVRSYGAYQTSGPAQPIYHAPVSTNGATPPPMQAGQGSGTGGGGYGSQPYNTVSVPKQ